MSETVYRCHKCLLHPHPTGSVRLFVSRLLRADGARFCHHVVHNSASDAGEAACAGSMHVGYQSHSAFLERPNFERLRGY